MAPPPRMPMARVPEPVTTDDLVDALIKRLQPGAELVVPIANGEPVGLLNGLEARAAELSDVTVHQMHVLRDRPYLHGTLRPHLRHVSWFLSHITRPLFRDGGCDFAPANFSEIPRFLADRQPAAVLAAASPPDRLGYFSLGVCADYAAALIGRVPFYLEVNEQMPRTYGANRLHHSEVEAWCTGDWELVEVPGRNPSPEEELIADFVADRVVHGATLQLGIGSIPGAVAKRLTGHRHLGVHTELLSDPVLDLVESGAVTGIEKRSYRGRIVTTFALGTRRLYDFCHENDAVVFLPVDEVNDPRNIGREPSFVSVNGTLEVDLMGQAASESLGSQYWSGSGGQADFARGSQYSKGGEGFIALRSTTDGGRVSRIVPTLRTGAVVTTPKNTVDNVVTEYGVAELRGKTVAERVTALIAVAAPNHRENLARAAEKMGLLRPNH